MLHALMKRLAEELKFTEEFEDRKGVYTFPIDEELVVEIRDEHPGFSLYCSLDKEPGEHRAELWGYLLRANLFGEGTSHAVLCLNEEGGWLTLRMKIDYPVDYRTFKEFLEDFTNEADFWFTQIRTKKYLSNNLYPK